MSTFSITRTLLLRVRSERSAAKVLRQLGDALGREMAAAHAERYWKDPALLKVVITNPLLTGDPAVAVFEALRRCGALTQQWNVRVFGSATRHEAGPDSDLDLLVDVGAEPAPFFPGGLLADVEELLGCRVDVVTEDGLHWYIRQRVLDEAVPL